MSEPVDAVDARTDRVAQSAIGIALLAAFVFRFPLVVPVLMLLVGIAAVGGPRVNALCLAYERAIAPRLPARATATDADRDPPVPVATVRAQDALATVILAVAGLGFLLGLGLVGWLLAIAEAVVAIVAATTRVHVAERLLRRLGG